MVCWFVQEEDVWLLKKKTAESNTAALTSRKNIYNLICRRTAESIHSKLKIVIKVPCIEGIKLLLNLTLANGSSFGGTFSGEITNAKDEAVSSEIGTVSVTLDETSTWTLTADTWIAEFSGNAENVIGNGYTLYVNGTALEGIR